MSDFIFSRSNIEPGKITEDILSIYHEEYPLVEEFHGEWGSLGVSKNLYNGFNSYENNQFITIVLGGPLLMFRDNSFLKENDNSEGTKAILDRWLTSEINWDEDLSGPFVVLIVDKKTSEITCITDLMSFIPVYTYSDATNIVLATHIDALAKTTQQSHLLDNVSLVDFVLNGIVTFPYTTYQNIKQILPGSIHTVERESVKLSTENYWLPLEKSRYKSINEASSDLRKNLQMFINKITNETDHIAQFISGGEDSRTLSGLLKDHQRKAFIFIDEMNREGEIARKVANIYDAQIKISTRNKLHYLDILPNCSDLVGSGSQYHHAHTYGFHNSCKLNSYDAVFGGLYSDALLKGKAIKKKKQPRYFPFFPDTKSNDQSREHIPKSHLFEQAVVEEIKLRRKEHLNYLKTLREKSAEEWFGLWPVSMNASVPNIHANRRLFRSYEPFMSSEIIKMSACIPQEWKLNRRLFYRTAKPYLKSSKWVLHGDGWLPSQPWYINKFVHFSTRIYRKVAKKVGRLKGNQGPWGDWNLMVHSSKWKKFLENKESLTKLPVIDHKISVQEILDTRLLSIEQYVNLTQVLYELDKKDQSNQMYEQ